MKRYFVHKAAICEAESIGAGTKVWAFAHVLSGAKIGKNVNICDHVFIENDVFVGDNSTIKTFVALWDGLRVGRNAFIGPNVVFSNDKYPRSRMWLRKHPKTFVGDGASIGSGAVICPGIRIGSFAMIAAGAVVASHVPDFALMKGVPAKISGFVCRCGAPLRGTKTGFECMLGDWRGVKPSPRMRCVRCKRR